jgi:hypothetical protein
MMKHDRTDLAKDDTSFVSGRNPPGSYWATLPLGRGVRHLLHDAAGLAATFGQRALDSAALLARTGLRAERAGLRLPP